MVSTELFIPPKPVKVLGGRHPLTNEHHQVEVRAGATIAEALDISIASTGLDWPQDRFVATVDDVRVPREWWHRVRPKPGTMVVFRPVASGDDSLRTILFLGIAVAALFIAPFIAGPAVLGLTGAALQAGTALIGGAITLGGALLLNALMPLRPPQQDTGQPKTLPMIQGASNEVRPWGSVPVILGRHRISPPYAAMPYSHFTGQVQYMSLLFALGYGPLHVEPKSLKIGETSIDPADNKFKDIQTEIDQAFDMEKFVKLFKRDVNELPLSLPLKSSLGWIARTTGDATSVISVDVIAAAGIWIFDKKTGKYKDRPVTVNVQYRKNVPGQPPHVGKGWIARPNIVFHVTRDTFRMGAQWNVTPAGLWDVRLRKATADYPTTGKDQVADAIIWQTLRGFQTGVPITFPEKLALIGINARASDQFNGVINTFNCVVQSYVWAYNGTTWVANQLSSNPADLFHHVLTGPANARPRKPGPGGYGDSSGDIDYDSIQRWWQDCRTYGYTYNAVISDQRTVRDVLSDIAAAGRATVALRNGRWGVSFPRASDPVSWHFTPRNSSGLKTTRTYREMPHALRVRYIDGSVKGGWKQTEGIVYNDTLDGSGPNGQYTATTAHLYETVEFPGITNWEHIHKAARFQLAQALLRPETHTLNADIESLRLERGDKVAMSTEVLLIGTGYGRVVSVDAATQIVKVDSRVIMVPGKTYQVKFTIVVVGAPQILTRTVLNSSSETDLLQLSPSDVPATLPARDNLFSFGETSLVTRDYRVLDVRPAADLTAQFTLVDDAPGIEFLGDVPEYDPGVDGQPDPFTMVPQSITFNESFSGFGITAKSTVQLTVQVPRVGTIRAFEFQSLDVDNSGDWTPFAVINAPLLTATKEGMEPGNYQFRVRALFREDYALGPNDFSAWVDQVTGMDGTKVDIVQVHNFSDLPPDVENFRVTVSGDTMRFEWDAVSFPNIAFYRLKYNSTTDTSALWGSSIELADPVETSVSLPTRSGTFLIKAVTFAQAESENENDIIIFTTAGAPKNILTTLFEAPASSTSPGDPIWQGTNTHTQIQFGTLLTLSNGTSVKDIATNQGLTSVSSNVRTIQQILIDLSITTGLKLLLESGNIASWPGSGQKWLDESGGGYDFFLGSSGTASPTDPAEPSFVGTPGDKTKNTYWSLDGGDYFTYDTTSEAWMDAIHKDNAQFTMFFQFYVPTLDSVVHYLTGNVNAGTDTGFQFYIDTNRKLQFIVVNGSGTLAYGPPPSATGITAVGWHRAALSIDEVAGTGTLMLDGVTEALTPVYISPSVAAATFKMQLAAAGNNNGVLANLWRLRSVVMWQGVALTAAQLTSLSSAVEHNDDVLGLKLLLESGTLASWPGSGQKWLDESGGGYDFFLGSSGTASPTDPAEPSFVGTAGDLTRNAYWNFDGGDYFTYDSTNEIWMDHIHKAGGVLTVMMSVYIPTLGSTYYLLGNTANNATKIGFNFFISADQLNFTVMNGTGTSAFSLLSTMTITATGWHVVGISLDETVGLGTFTLDGVNESFIVAYTNPSDLPSSYPLQIGAAGNSVTPLPSGTHLRSVGVWEGMILSDDQMIAFAAIANTNANFYLYQGFYQFFNFIDLGSVYTSRITSNVIANGLSAGDTMDHWARLSDVVALDTTDPSSWSIEMVYSSTIGYTSRSISQIISDLGLTGNLKLLVEAGTVASWPGTGQKWLDEAGGGYDFFLGSSGTASPTDPAEPSFVGTVNDKTKNTYWSFDGADYFTYDSANETWMQNLHKDGAKFTILMMYYPTGAGTTRMLMGDVGAVTGNPGFNFFLSATNLIDFAAGNSSGGLAINQSGMSIAVNTWHVSAISLDENAGVTLGNFFFDNGVFSQHTPTYTTPSAANATNTLQIGAAGNNLGPVSAGTRIAFVAIWEGITLTQAQISALYDAINHNDDWLWSDWTPFAIADVTARAITFGIRLNGSPDGSISPAVSTLKVTIDMPDRHEGYHYGPEVGGSGTGGILVKFDPPFKKLTDVVLANFDLNTTERYTLTQRDERGVVVTFYNSAGVSISKTFDLHAYGYGEVVGS